ncbi:MAG: hypothetical protein RI906_3340 [Pseudomonadota bacterium]|jgi:hypothetical protein
MFGRVKLWLGGAAALMLAFIVVWAAGRREGHQEARSKALRSYVDTRKRIDEADDLGDDPDIARRWLRERAKSGGDL